MEQALNDEHADSITFSDKKYFGGELHYKALFSSVSMGIQVFFQSLQADTDNNVALQLCLGQATVILSGYSL